MVIKTIYNYSGTPMAYDLAVNTLGDLVQTANNQGPATQATLSQYWTNASTMLLYINAFLVQNAQNHWYVPFSNAQYELTPLINTPLPPTYSKLYLGHYATITDDVINLGGSKLQNIASAVNAGDAVNKANLDSAIATATSASETFATIKVDEQKVRIDLILEGAGLSLDALKEVSDYANSLHSTQAQDILSATTTLTTSLGNEVSRATTAEADLKKKMEFESEVFPVASVIADAQPPALIPLAIKSNFTPGTAYNGRDGWYFKNTTAGHKVNWYLHGNYTLTVKEILNMSFDATLYSLGSRPFITLYTRRKETDALDKWYNAKATYVVPNSSELSTYKDYQFYTNTLPDTVLPGTTPYALTLSDSPVATVGTMSADDQILFASIGSDSAADANAVEFKIESVRFHTPSGTFKHKFNSLALEIAAVSSSVSSNGSSLTTAIDAVSTNLGLEAARATAAETALSTTISNENTRALAAEASLQTSINTLTSDLSALTTEQAADIATELARALAAEAALSTRCDNLQAQQLVQAGHISALYQYFFNTSSGTIPQR